VNEVIGYVEGSAGRRAGGRVMLVGPLPPPPVLGGIATGISLLLGSELAEATSMTLFNTWREPGAERWLITRIATDLGSLLLFLTALLRVRPQLVHVKTAAGINFYQQALRVLAARLMGRRVVLQIHDGTFPVFFDRSSRFRQSMIRRLLRLPHAVVALSPGWADYFHTRLGVPTVEVVPNGLWSGTYTDTASNRASLGIPRERVTILFVGTRSAELDLQKGLGELIEAVATIRRSRPEVMLVLAGGVSHAERLRSSLGPEGEGWHAIGPVSVERKPALYRSVDVFALPSAYENMPNTLLEAMAAGLAVVATPVGAVSEMVDDGRDGFLVPVGDVQALTDRLDRLAGDAALRERMGAMAADTVREKYDFRVVQEKLAILYRRVAGIRPQIAQSDG
jgi:glycosyltransferase involved in cell wall biosynthesis